MTSKEKLKKCLSHEPGPVPVDFGGTAVTGIHCSVVAELRRHYGLEKHPIKVVEPYQMLGEVEGDLKEALGIDVIGVFPRNTMFGFPMDDWKEWQTPWGQDVLVPSDFNTTRSGEDVLIYPEGDVSVGASGKMPGSGYFFDSIVRQPPIDDENLNPEDNLEEFNPVTVEDLDYFEKTLKEADATGLGVIANFGGTAFGDIALVPGPFLKNPKGIRDVTEWYVSTAMRQDYIHAVFEKQAEIAVGNLSRIFDRVGNLPDAVFICGTDFGTQDSQFCSVDTYNSLYAPYYKKVNSWIHKHTEWKTFKHSCGAVYPFMEPFIESGFDIINPVQCSAAEMDPRTLKNNFGDDIVFWGGGVDTQRTLPFGTPEEVKKEVLERLEIFSENGGYVFDAIHNVQAKSPIENMAAMFDAVREFRSN